MENTNFECWECVCAGVHEVWSATLEAPWQDGDQRQAGVGQRGDGVCPAYQRLPVCEGQCLLDIYTFHSCLGLMKQGNQSDLNHWSVDVLT